MTIAMGSCTCRRTMTSWPSPRGIIIAWRVKSDGSLAGWGGHNGSGETTVPAGNDFVAIAAGGTPQPGAEVRRFTGWLGQ